MQKIRYLVLVLALVACSAVARAQNLPPITANNALGAQDAGACVTAGAYASWTVPKVSAVAFNVSGTYSGTLTFYGQVNGGWVSLLVSNLSTGAQGTTTTTTGNFSAPNPGLTAVCISFTTKASGTPVVIATQGYGVSRLTPVAPAFPATFTAGDLLYAGATTTVAGLADAAAGQVLASGGVGAAPAYTATPTLTSVTASTAFIGPGTPASAGGIRLQNGENIKFRNAANNGDVTALNVNGSNNAVIATTLDLNGNNLQNFAQLTGGAVAKVLIRGAGTNATQFSTTQTTVPTCSSNCGTSPSVAGTDTAGIVTMGGTGSPASGWVVTFNGTWPAAPSCVVIMAKAGMASTKSPLTVVTSTTTFTVVTNGVAPANSDVYAYHCIGVQ